MAITAPQFALAQNKIPVRTLTSATTVSPESFGAILGIRQLPGKRVLVSDAKKHRLLVLDSTLNVVSVILDSVPGQPNSYDQNPKSLIAYPGDSTITFDFAAQTLLLLDPTGHITRAMAIPNARDLNAMAGSAAYADERGRLVFRGVGRSGMGGSSRTPLMVTNDDDGLKSNADSVPLLRANLQARITDTIATLKNPNGRRVALDTINGTRGITVYINPLQTGDEWAMLADGTVAVVREHDYHVDWISSSGQVTSTAKLPFDWKRLEENDKQRILDSARARDSTDRIVQSENAEALSGGSARAVAQQRESVLGTGRGGGGDAGSLQTRPAMGTAFVSVSEIPDHLPPIRAGAARIDLEGNLWILPATSAQSLHGELVYDVVNRKGVLFERVRLLAGRVIAGFGGDGIVYLTSGSLTNGFRLERTR